MTDRSHRHSSFAADGREMDVTWSVRSASTTAGVALLVLAVAAGFGRIGAIGSLVSTEDATQTALDISASETLFRIGVACLFLAVVADVVVSWALYRVLRPVSASLSLLAAAVRLVYAAVFAAAVGELVGVLRFLGDDAGHTTSDSMDPGALIQINAFDDVWQMGLLLFGVHLLLVGFLVYRSGVFPRFLGALVAIAGLGYVIDSSAVVVAGSSPDISRFTFIGELLLAFWLLSFGRRRHGQATA